MSISSETDFPNAWAMLSTLSRDGETDPRNILPTVV